MNKLLESLKGGMIISCQAEGTDPFNKPEYIALFAKAAEMGGACAIRTEGIAKLNAIKEITSLPISNFDDGFVRITGRYKDVEDLLDSRSDIIAIDGTFRKREGLSGSEFINKIKMQYPDVVILADVAKYEEAIACQEAGADCISTTLSGYTPDTKNNHNGPDFGLIELLSNKLQVPLFAEGRINTPEEAKRAIKLGAYAVISGTAITRPRVITQWFVQAVKNKQSKIY